MKVIDRLLVKAGTRGAQRLLGWATLVGLAATTVLGLFVVPADADQGDVLRLIYVGYLSLRSVADSPSRRAHWSAVVGVVGFVDVPIVHMSVVWWRSLHQEATVVRPGAPTMDGSMLLALLVGTIAFSLAYSYLMAVRMRVGRLEDHAAGSVMATTSPRPRAPRYTASASSSTVSLQGR